MSEIGGIGGNQGGGPPTSPIGPQGPKGPVGNGILGSSGEQEVPPPQQNSGPSGSGGPPRIDSPGPSDPENANRALDDFMALAVLLFNINKEMSTQKLEEMINLGMTRMAQQELAAEKKEEAGQAMMKYAIASLVLSCVATAVAFGGQGTAAISQGLGGISQSLSSMGQAESTGIQAQGDKISAGAEMTQTYQNTANAFLQSFDETEQAIGKAIKDMIQGKYQADQAIAQR